MSKMEATQEVDVFKRPAEPSKRPRKVLSEEKFAEALEKIIQRDCFPDLEKLKAQNAYLDAVANNDIQMMRELSNKYSVGRNTPSITRDANETPSTFETPSSVILAALSKNLNQEGSTPSIHMGQPEFDQSSSKSDTRSVISGSSSRTKKSSKEPHDMELNEFLNIYTSEDDHSFQEIVEEGIRKHKIKYAWLYEQEDVRQDLVNKCMALPSILEQQSIEYQRPSNISTWTYKNKNAVMYIPDGVPLTSEELANAAKRKPEVAFKHTRFSKKPYKIDDKQSVATATKTFNLIRGMTEGKIGVDGREVNAKATPSVNGFKIVRTPSPTPGYEESPFLTWGEIEGTPFRLDASDTPVPSTIGSPFRMMDTSKRERIALELAEKVSKRYRDKKQKTLEVAKSYLTSPSPRPKTHVERMNSMSPAAQRFALTLMKKTDPGTPRTPRL